jgi:hypothetical protein
MLVHPNVQGCFSGDRTKTSQRPIASMLDQLHLVVGVQDSKKQNAAKACYYNNVQAPCT